MSLKITSSDRETARQLVSAIEHADTEAVARILAFLRDQTISCALVDARRERELETTGHDADSRRSTVGSEQSEAGLRQLRRSLTLLYDAACYPNEDITELQIVGARDQIAEALGLKKRRKARAK
jgi:hypothetical protein